MELKQIRNKLGFYKRTQNIQGSREETMEMIVPDACPDISQILDSCGQCRLTRSEITESGILLSGTVQVITLYQPEGEVTVRKLEAEIPFQHVYECQQPDRSGRLLAKAWVSGSETRVMNPRKVLLRVNVTEQLRCFCQDTISFCQGIDAEPELGIQQQIQQLQTTMIKQVTEKEFTLNDELSLNTGRKSASELLRVLPSVQYSEARLIGTKLVIKGSVNTNLLMRSEEGQLYTIEAELPFSQMLDAGEMSDDAAFDLILSVRNYSYGQLSQDGRTIPVTFELAANGVFYETVPLALLTDAYSVNYPMTIQREVLLLQQVKDVSERQSIREPMELNVPVQNICAYHGELGTAISNHDQGQLKISLPITVSAVYEGEDGRLEAVQRTFTVEKQFGMAEHSTWSLYCALTQLDALTAATGIEVRCSVEFDLRINEEQDTDAVSSGAMDQEKPLQRNGQPSVLLLRPSENETLWDIAKRYQTTCEDIHLANGITDGQRLGGKMLLIPKAR